MKITPGEYKMRGGGIAEITETGCFAYGDRGGTEDLWQVDGGKHVPLKAHVYGTEPSKSGHSKYDLVERVK